MEPLEKALEEVERFEGKIEKLRRKPPLPKFGFKWPWSKGLPSKLSLALYQLDARLYGKKSFFGNLNDQQVRELAAKLHPIVEKYKLPFSPYPEGKFKGNAAVIGGALALVCELEEDEEVQFYFRGKMGGPLRKKWIPDRHYLEDPLYDPRKFPDHYLVRLPLSELEKIGLDVQIGRISYLPCQILPVRRIAAT